MNRKFITVLILSFLLLRGMATPVDSVKTYYKDSQFITYCKLWVDAPRSIMNEVAGDYVHQAKYNLDELMEWALKGMKLRSEKDNLIVFNFKSTTYDEKNDLIKGIGDVRVPGIISFPDIHVDSRMTRSQLANGKTKVTIDVLYSDAFLKKTSGVFFIIPQDEKGCWLTLETKVQFGWFFNIFITQPTFKYIMEWRFQRMMQNIRDEAEHRARKGVTNTTKQKSKEV